MNSKGFALLSVLIAVQIWVLALSFSYFFIQTIMAQQKSDQQKLVQIYQAQEILEKTKDLPWSAIASDSDRGILVQDMTAELKQVRISTVNFSLETIVFKGSL